LQLRFSGLSLKNPLFSKFHMPQLRKPPALRSGDAIRILSLASPVEQCLVDKGGAELERLGYGVELDDESVFAREGYFAGTAQARLKALEQSLAEPQSAAIFCSCGGYGSTYLLDKLSVEPSSPKILLGHSDITSLQIYLWQKFAWVTFHGPMVASGFANGAGAANGYDSESLLHALSDTGKGWSIQLDGECMAPGSAEGVLLGGCLTLIITSLGTPWELDTRGAILVLEDRGMKPYQVDRALMHLKQAGKFDAVAGIVLGDFPECEAPGQSEPVKTVAQRVLGSLGVPIVWGAAVGHTSRPMLTLPFGVRARVTSGEQRTQLEILEPACVV
jgi:muramoyltetrapeptide carboxypeptidase